MDISDNSPRHYNHGRKLNGHHSAVNMRNMKMLYESLAKPVATITPPINNNKILIMQQKIQQLIHNPKSTSKTISTLHSDKNTGSSVKVINN